MTETRETTPDGLLPAIIEDWPHVSAENIIAVADELYRVHSISDRLTSRRQEQLTADSDILMSLAALKGIATANTTTELLNVWAAVIDGEGLEYGGMIHGEESQHYKRAMNLVHLAFRPKVLIALDQDMQEAALKASTLPTAELRATAYQDAADDLSRTFDGFSCDAFDFESDIKNKVGLLEQLAEAEEE